MKKARKNWKLQENSICRGCGQYGISWSEQRRQYGRMLRRGMSSEAVKGLLPRCQKCVTVLLASETKATVVHRA
jgi:hypothetical protein